jgi:hypothetical protein
LDTYTTPKGDETGTKADAVEARAIVAATINFILNGMAGCRRLFCYTTVMKKSDEQLLMSLWWRKGALTYYGKY